MYKQSSSKSDQAAKKANSKIANMLMALQFGQTYQVAPARAQAAPAIAPLRHSTELERTARQLAKNETQNLWPFDSQLTMPAAPMTDDKMQLAQWNQELLARVQLADASTLASDHLHSTSKKNPQQLAHQYQREGKLFAVSRAGKTQFPVFQIDPDSHRPYPEVQELVIMFPELKANPSRGMALLRWMDQAHPMLRGRTPLDCWLAGERSAVVQALAWEQTDDANHETSR